MSSDPQELYENSEYVRGFSKKCILLGMKGATVLSRVSTLDFDESMKKMRGMLSLLDEKSFLSDKIPSRVFDLLRKLLNV
ncbi:MAG: hypothetical protein HXS48_02375 [Theionarchaea archaeon]|nr:hypothetical protein [Theionarchaea archaeon]